MEADAFDAPDAEDREAVLMLQPPKFPFNGGAATVEPAPFVALVSDRPFTLTVPASPEARSFVAAMAERILMEHGYHEMADETLPLAREARAAQIRALLEE